MPDNGDDRQTASRRKRLVIAGASGSMGTAVCRALADDYDILAVTHLEARARNPIPDLPVTWRHCDMFSRSEMVEALAGADYAIYLIHTRLASARLDQAQCEDMELIIADNFATAAMLGGVKQIICLRGLLPKEALEPEIARRRNEVVEALQAFGTPVTVIRASLVVAPGSTAVNLIASQVARGRFVPVPAWAQSRKQPVALPDLLRAIRHCLGRPESFAGSFDIGGPTVMDWRQILEQTAELLGRRPRFLSVGWLSPRLYAWWLRMRSPATHPATIRLMVDDLRHDSVARDNPLQTAIADDSLDPREAIRPYLDTGDRSALANPRSPVLGVYEAQLREARSVRSIQRMSLPKGQDATWMADTYFRWLESFLWPFVRCSSDAYGSIRVQVRGLPLTLLELGFRPDHSAPDRRMYFITGGLLASGTRNLKGRMEFHDVLDGRYTIIAIHDFAPSLPWNIYQATQAAAHGFVMRAFQRHMAKIAGTGTTR
jgi:nucleoside-diphosphate-sugar epimerase